MPTDSYSLPAVEPLAPTDWFRQHSLTFVLVASVTRCARLRIAKGSWVRLFDCSFVDYIVALVDSDVSTGLPYV